MNEVVGYKGKKQVLKISKRPVHNGVRLDEIY